jgi:dipeptidyl aminopeptidase/acylaminoacyl peptidase
MRNKIIHSAPLLALSLGLAVTATPAFAQQAASGQRAMTPDDLVTLKRVGSPAVSPDGTMMVYAVRTTDMEANKGRFDLYLEDAKNPLATATMVASVADANETDPVFSADGKSIYYLSDAGGKSQIYRYDLAVGSSTQVSNTKADISGFKLSPKGDKIAIWGDIAKNCATFGCDSDGNRAAPGPGTGREYDAMFVRHWDAWETPGNYSRIFVFDMADGKISGDGVAMDGGPDSAIIGDAPGKPFGGGEEVAWSADGGHVLYALRIADKDEPRSTDLNIYAAKADGSAVDNWTAANKGTDTLPATSPDGKWTAWVAMARAGYEADRQVVQLRNNATGAVTPLTQDWDRSVGSIAWAADSKSIYVTAGDTLDTPLFRVDLKGKVTRLTQDGHVSVAVPLKDGGVIIGLDTIHAPTELYRLSPNGALNKLTEANDAVFAQIAPVTVERFSFIGADGDIVWGQIVKPTHAIVPDYLEGGRKLPVAFLVHGGPQGSFGNSWSFRWNPKTFASAGYAAVMVDFHGSTGYGQAFTDSIQGDWGGKPLTDLKLGLAAAGARDAWIDIGNACALGASYGGYMMNWISGQWNDGFKCIVNHAGVFDLRAMAFETEEIWFDEWDQKGPWWERPDAEKWNPVNHVTNWRMPTLVTAGEKDFRIPYSQSLAAFTALQRQGIESKLLIFPDENHWINKPNNSRQWYGTVLGWLDQHLKAE